jgi:hypothetical protein
LLHGREPGGRHQLGPRVLGHLELGEGGDAAHLRLEVGEKVGVVDHQDVGQVPMRPEGRGVVMVGPERPSVRFPAEQAAGHPVGPQLSLGGRAPRHRPGRATSGIQQGVGELGVGAVVVEGRHEHVSSVAADVYVPDRRVVRQSVERQVALQEPLVLLGLDGRHDAIHVALEGRVDPR